MNIKRELMLILAAGMLCGCSADLKHITDTETSNAIPSQTNEPESETSLTIFFSAASESQSACESARETSSMAETETDTPPESTSADETDTTIDETENASDTEESPEPSSAVPILKS